MIELGYLTGSYKWTTSDLNYAPTYGRIGLYADARTLVIF